MEYKRQYDLVNDRKKQQLWEDLHMPGNQSKSTQGPLNVRSSLWLGRDATDGDSIRGKLSLNRSEYAIDQF